MMRSSLALFLLGSLSDLAQFAKGAVYVQIRAIDGSPCIAGDSKCYLGSTVAIDHGCTGDANCKLVVPTFNSTASISVITDWTQAVQTGITTSGSAAGVRTSVTCGSLSSSYVRRPEDVVGFAFASFEFPSSAAGSFSLKYLMDQNCVGNDAAYATASSATYPWAAFSASCGSTISANGACWALSYSASVYNYYGQVTPACRTGTTDASTYANSVAGCMNNATHPDVWSPVLMLANPHSHYESSAYTDFYFSGSQVKLYFNEPVKGSAGRICMLAYTSSGVYDASASSCSTASTAVTSTGFEVALSTPSTKNRKYYIIVEGNALSDKANNYFPGINGRRYSGSGYTQSNFPDQCAVSGADDAAKWPATGLLHGGHHCEISFVKPLGKPSVSLYPLEPPPADTASMSAIPAKIPADLSTLKFVGVASDTSVCYEFSESIYFHDCPSGTCTSGDWSINQLPAAANLKFQVVANYSGHGGTFTTTNSECSHSQLTTSGRAGCTYVTAGSDATTSPSMKVHSVISSTASAQCWMRPGLRGICCNPSVGSTLASVKASHSQFSAYEPQLLIANAEEGTFGYTGVWQHFFWVNASDANSAAPVAKWISWEGIEIDVSGENVVPYGFTQSAITTVAGYTNTSGYWQGIQIQWNRAVALNTGYVRFVPESYLAATGKSSAFLAASDYWTSTTANPGCQYTHEVHITPGADAYKAVFGKPCRIPTGNSASYPADMSLYSSDHLVVNPRSLIPGATYNVSVDYGLVKGLADASSMNAQISFSASVKQAINWGTYASSSSISPTICCSAGPAGSLTSIYANMDAGYIHYSQNFLTTFYGPVTIGSGDFMMKCYDGGSVNVKVTIPAMDKDQVIVRGLKLIIDPRDGNSDKLWMPSVGTAKCFWEAGADAIKGLAAGSQISPYFTVMRGDERAPQLVDVFPWAPSTCTASSSPACVTQKDLSMAPGRNVDSTAGYGTGNEEDSYITLTFDEMVKFGDCDITLKASSSPAAFMGRSSFVWDLDGVTTTDSVGAYTVGDSPFSSYTNNKAIESDITTGTTGATAATSKLSVRLFDLQKTESTTESGTAAVASCDGDGATPTGFCSTTLQRAYQLVLELPKTTLGGSGAWTLEIPKCSFVDWSVEATNTAASNGIVSGNTHFTGVDVISVPITMSSDRFAPNITYSPCGPSGSSPQGKKVKGNCFNLAGVEPNAGTPSFYKFPYSSSRFDVQGMITGLSTIRQSQYFLSSSNLKHTVPVMLEFDESVTMDTNKKCYVAAGAYNTTVAASASGRLFTSPLYGNYQSQQVWKGARPSQNTTDGTSYSNYASCVYTATEANPSGPCLNAKNEIVMSKFASSYTWLSSYMASDVKPDDTTNTAAAGKKTLTGLVHDQSSDDEFANVNFFKLGDTSIVQHNGTVTECTSEVGSCTASRSVDRVFFFLQFDPTHYRSGPLFKQVYYQLSCEAAAFTDAAGNAADPTGIDYRFAFDSEYTAPTLDSAGSYPNLNSFNCTTMEECQTDSKVSVTNSSNIMWAFNRPVQFRPYAYDGSAEWGSKAWNREGWSSNLAPDVIAGSNTPFREQLYATFYNGTDGTRFAWNSCNETIFGREAVESRCEKNVSITDYAILSADSKKMIFSTRVHMISNLQSGNYGGSNPDGYGGWAKWFGVHAPAGLLSTGNATASRNNDNYLSRVTASIEETDMGSTGHFSYPATTSPDMGSVKAIYGYYNPGSAAGMYDKKPELLMVLPGAVLNYGLMTGALSTMDQKRLSSGRFPGSWAHNGAQLTTKPRRAFQQKVYGHSPFDFRLGIVMSDAVTMTGDSAKLIKVYDCGEYIRMYGSIVYDPNCNTPAADTSDEAASGNYAATATATPSTAFSGVFTWGTGVTEGNREAKMVASVKADGTCGFTASSSCDSAVRVFYNNTVGLNYMVDQTWIDIPSNFSYGHKYTMEMDAGFFAANASYTVSQSDSTVQMNVKTTGLTLKSSGEAQADTATLIGSRVTPWYTMMERPEAVKSKLSPADGATMVDVNVVPQVWFQTAVIHTDNWIVTGTSNATKAFFTQDSESSRPEARELNNATAETFCTGLICSFYLNSWELSTTNTLSHMFGAGLLPGRKYALSIAKNSIKESNNEMAYLGMPREDHEQFRAEGDIAYSYAFSTREMDTMGPQLLYCCVVSRDSAKYAANQCDNGYTFEELATNVTVTGGKFKWKCVFDEPIMFTNNKGRVYDLDNLAAVGSNHYFAGNYETTGCFLSSRSSPTDKKMIDCSITNHSLIAEVPVGVSLTAETNYTFVLRKDMIRDYSNNTMDFAFNVTNNTKFYHNFVDLSAKTPAQKPLFHPDVYQTFMEVPAMKGQDITPLLDGYRKDHYTLNIVTQKTTYQEGSTGLKVNGFTVAATTGPLASSSTNAKGWPDAHIYDQSSTPTYVAAPTASNLGSYQPSFMPTDRVLIKFNDAIQPYLTAGQTDADGLTYASWSTNNKVMIEDCGPSHQCSSGLTLGSTAINGTVSGGTAGYSRTDSEKLELIFGYDSVLVNPGGATPLSFSAGHKYRVVVPAKLVKYASDRGFGGKLASNGMFDLASHNTAREYIDFIVSTATEDRRVYSPLGTSTLATQYLKSGVTGASQDTVALIDHIYDDASGTFINYIDQIKAYIMTPDCSKIVATVSSSSTDPGTNALSVSKTMSGVTTDKYIWIFFPEKLQLNTKQANYHVYLNHTDPAVTGLSNGANDGMYKLADASFSGGYYLKFQISAATNMVHNGLDYTLGIQNGAFFTTGGMKRGTVQNANAPASAASTPMGSWENLGISDEVRPKFVHWHNYDGTIQNDKHQGTARCFRLKMASYESADQVDTTPPTLRGVYPLNGTLDVNPATMMYLDFADNYTTLVGSGASNDVKLFECNVRLCSKVNGRSNSNPAEQANFESCCDYTSCSSYASINTRTGTGLCDTTSKTCTQPDLFWQPYMNTTASSYPGEQRTRLYMRLSTDSSKPYLNAGKCYVMEIQAGLMGDAGTTQNTNAASLSYTAGTSKAPAYWFRTLKMPETEYNFVQPKVVSHYPANNAVDVGKYESISITFDKAMSLDTSAAGTSSYKKSIYLRTYDPTQNSADPNSVVSTGKRYIDCTAAETDAQNQYIVASNGDDYTRRHAGPFQLSTDGMTLRIFPQGFSFDNRMTCVIISPFALKEAATGNYYKGMTCGEFCFRTAPSLYVAPTVLDYFPRDKDDMSVNDALNWNNPHWYIFDRDVKATSASVHYGTVGTGSSTALSFPANANKASTDSPSTTTVSGANYLGFVDISGSQVLVSSQSGIGHGKPQLGFAAGAFTSIGGKKVSAMSAESDYKVVFEAGPVTPVAGTMVRAVFSEVNPMMYGGSTYGGSADYQRTEAASAYCNSTLYVMGGKRNGGASSQFCQSADDGKTYTCADNPAFARLNAHLACTEHDIYVAGGAAEGFGLMKSSDYGATWMPVGTEGFMPVSIPTQDASGDWMEGVAFPTAGLEGVSMTVASGWRVLLCGGGLESCWRCAEETCMYWERSDAVAPAIRDRMGGKMISVSGKIYLIGGHDATGYIFEDVWMSSDDGKTWEIATAQIDADGQKADGTTYSFMPRVGACVVATGDDRLHIIGGQNTTSTASASGEFLNDYYTSYFGRYDSYDSTWAAANDLTIGGETSTSQYAARPQVIGFEPYWQSSSSSGSVKLLFSENLMDSSSPNPNNVYSTRLIWLCASTTTVGCSSVVGSTATTTYNAAITYLGVCNATESAVSGKGCCRAITTVSNDAVKRPVLGTASTAVYLRKADGAKATMGQNELLTGTCEANTYLEINGPSLEIKGLDEWTAYNALSTGTRVYVFVPENSVFDKNGNTVYKKTDSISPAATTSMATLSTAPTTDEGFEYYFVKQGATALAVEGFYPAAPSSETLPTAADFNVALDTNVIFKFNVPMQKYWNQKDKYLRFTSQGEYSISSTSYAMAETFNVAVNDSMIIDERTVMFKVAPKRLTPGHKYKASLDAKSFVPASFDNTPSANMADNDGGDANAVKEIVFFTIPKISDDFEFSVGTAATMYKSAVAAPSCEGMACYVGTNGDGDLSVHAFKSDKSGAPAVNEAASYPSNYATDVPLPTAADCSAPAEGLACTNFRIVFDQYIMVNETGSFQIRNGSAIKSPTTLASSNALSKTIDIQTDVKVDELQNTTWFQLSTAHGLAAGTWYEIVIPTNLIFDYAATPQTAVITRTFRTLDASVADSMPMVAYFSVDMNDVVPWFKTDVDVAGCAAASAGDSNRAKCLPVYNGLAKNFTFYFSEPVVAVAAADASSSLRGSDGAGGFLMAANAPSASFDAASESVKVSINDDEILAGVDLPSDSCVATSSGCLGEWWLSLPNSFVQNAQQAAACAAGTTAACTMGMNNGTAIAAAFKTYRPEPVKLMGSKLNSNNGAGFYPTNQATTNYYTYTSESSVIVQFSKPVMKGNSDVVVDITATSTYNDRSIPVSSSAIEITGNFMTVDEPLVPGEEYTVSVKNATVRDYNGYLLEIPVGDTATTTMRDQTKFGVAPLIRFRQNYATAASNELGLVTSEACDYASDMQSSSSKCVGFTPRSFFGVCAVSPVNDIVVAGGYCKYCGSFGRQYDSTGRSVMGAPSAAETSNRTFTLETKRSNYAQVGTSSWSACTEVCSSTETTMQVSLLVNEASFNGYKATTKFGIPSNDKLKFNAEGDLTEYMGVSTNVTCASNQCMNCITGPTIDSCVSEGFSTMYSSEDPEFSQVAHGDSVSTYECAPGSHTFGQEEGVRDFLITCKAERYGYSWDIPASAESTICANSETEAMLTCIPDRCQGTGAVPDASSFDPNAVVAEGSCTGTTMFLDSCPIACAAGYEQMTASDEYALKCVSMDTASGTGWTTYANGAPTAEGDAWGCVPMTCPSLSDPMYASEMMMDGAYTFSRNDIVKSCYTDSVTYTEFCVAKCALGYVNGASRMTAMTCGLSKDGGVEISAVEECQPVQCPAMAVPAQANFTQVECTSGELGSGCFLSCPSGYSLSENVANITYSSTCVCADEECLTGVYDVALMEGDFGCMVNSAPAPQGRTQQVTQKLTVALAVPDLGEYATVDEYFVGNEPAITGSVCVSVKNTAFSGLSNFCMQDHVAGVVDYDEFCTEACDSCMVCETEMVASERRKLQDNSLNLETTYTVETTADAVAAVTAQATALAEADEALTSSLNTAVQEALAANDIVVSEVGVAAEAVVITAVETTSTTTTPAPEEESSSNVGGIVGGVVGGVVGVTVGLLAYKNVQSKKSA